MRMFSNVSGILMVGDVHPITGAVFAHINPKSVVVDSQYQRILNTKHLDFIKASFWKYAMSTPLISVRDGKLNAVDGQHTIQLAILLGYTTIPVWLYSLSFKDEAKLFAIKNSGRFNRKVSRTQGFIASMMSGDEMAIHIQKICEEEGFTTPFNQEGKRGHADFNCISILEDVYKYKYGSPEALHKFLGVLKVFKINGTLDKSARAKEFLRGLYDFMLSRTDLSACKIRVMIKQHGKSAGSITSMASELACNGNCYRNHFRQVFETLAKI